jgi:hypothetical protein
MKRKRTRTKTRTTKMWMIPRTVADAAGDVVVLGHPRKTIRRILMSRSSGKREAGRHESTPQWRLGSRLY